MDFAPLPPERRVLRWRSSWTALVPREGRWRLYARAPHEPVTDAPRSFVIATFPAVAEVRARCDSALLAGGCPERPVIAPSRGYEKRDEVAKGKSKWSWICLELFIGLLEQGRANATVSR